LAKTFILWMLQRFHIGYVRTSLKKMLWLD
jgi:hypothetical protein